MAYDLRASTIRATLPETDPPLYGARHPGARLTWSDLHGNPIGTVHWVQGRCMLLLVSEGELPLRRRALDRRGRSTSVPRASARNQAFALCRAS